MLQTSAVSDAVELAVLERSGFVESRHAGVGVVLAPDGSTVAELGNAGALVLPRSSLKPMQAIASVTAGAQLEGELLGVATASHSGTARHARAVREILALARLTPEALACPPALPSDRATYREMLDEGFARPDPIHHNCSGKHAAMLLACVSAEWPTDGYLDPSHPLQLHVREVVERLTGEKIAALAIDGCGAPVPAITLNGLARGIHRIGASSEKSPFALHRVAGQLVRTVRECPWTIAGPGQPDTVLIERLGLFAKGGAEGVMVAVAPNGTTVVLKTLDGSNRIAPVVAVHLLTQAGALDPAEAAATVKALRLGVSGGGKVVGELRPTVSLG